MEKTEEDINRGENDNILNSYSAENPEHPDWSVYEYHSHRKVLVQVDSETGRIHFLREVSATDVYKFF